MSMDSLQELIRKKKNPTVVGLDPKIELIPKHILAKHIERHGESLMAAAESFFEFNTELIDGLADYIPAVKLQSACYELLGVEGIGVMKRTIDYAKSSGLFVICDVKRNDIDATAKAYSEAYLGSVQVGNTVIEPFGCDACTINVYMGSDSVKPFVETCKRNDKCFFALSKTSNYSSVELQDLLAGDRFVYKIAADLTAYLSRGTEGKYGFSCGGLVVGATYPSDLEKMRELLPSTFFLVPGYGYQGGLPKDVSYAFNKFGHGAVINSSRGIIAAWQKTGMDGTDYVQAARAEAEKMRKDIREFVTIV